MLKQGLAIQLQQSPFLSLFPEARVRQTLREMNRPPDARVTAQTAREICVRHNLKALIAGSIAPLGSHYAITLEAINGQSGSRWRKRRPRPRARSRCCGRSRRRRRGCAGSWGNRSARSSGSTSRWNRPRLQSWRRSRPGPEALSIRTAAGSWKRSRFTDARSRLDPDFAQAYSVLSAVYWGIGQPGLAAESAEKGVRGQGPGERIRAASHHQFLSWLCHRGPEQADRGPQAAHSDVPTRGERGTYRPGTNLRS